MEDHTPDRHSQVLNCRILVGRKGEVPPRKDPTIVHVSMRSRIGRSKWATKNPPLQIMADLPRMTGRSLLTSL